MEKIMAILTSEIDYSRELAAYLASCEDFPYKPVVFSDQEAYTRFALENRISLLLCDKESIAPECESYAEKVCFLSEYSAVSETDDGDNTVFKYQSTEQIKSELMRRFEIPAKAAACAGGVLVRRRIPESAGIYENEDFSDPLMGSALPQDEPERGGARIICVCSPSGGSRCSTYAYALAEFFAKKGETLFVSLDPFFTLSQDLPVNECGSLKELIYSIETSLDGGYDLLSGYVRRKHGADCLAGITNWLDVYDITSDQAHHLMSCIQREKMYRYVVMDIGRPTGAFLECMALCTDIYVPRRKGRHDDEVLALWKDQLNALGFGDIAERLKERTLPFDKGLEAEPSYERLLSGSLAGYVRETEEFGYFG